MSREETRRLVSEGGMLRNLMTKPTLERVFASGRYWAAAMDGVAETDEGTVLTAVVSRDELSGEPEIVPVRFERPSNLLERFARLATGSQDDITACAQEWGLLGLCSKHGKPWPHGVTLSACEGFQGWERVSDWQVLAGQVEAVLRISAKLRKSWRAKSSEPAPVQDWIPLAGQDLPEPGWPRRTADSDWIWLGNHLTVWYFWAEPQLDLRWGPEGRLDIDLTARGLFGIIYRELVFTVARIDGFAICDGCGRPFVPKRKPASGKKSWCDDPECNTRAKNRVGQQSKRKRDRS